MLLIVLIANDCLNDLIGDPGVFSVSENDTSKACGVTFSSFKLLHLSVYEHWKIQLLSILRLLVYQKIALQCQ